MIVATLPSYYALTEEQMYGYYKNLADAITGPLMLYNILATTHMTIPVDVVKRLADHPNIVGLKDSERDLDRMQQCIAISKDREDFAYLEPEVYYDLVDKTPSRSVATASCPAPATMSPRCSTTCTMPPLQATWTPPTVCRTRPTR